MKLHALPPQTDEMDAPSAFTYPFCYRPHPLCVSAAREVQRYLSGQTCWSRDLAEGKMFGVLVVGQGSSRGFLAAFSGTLGGCTVQDYFVPPVFDLMAPGCHFQLEQDEISCMNARIETLRRQICPNEELKRQAETELNRFAEEMKCARQERVRLRAALSPEELARIEPELIRQSQFQKAEYKRLKARWARRLSEEDAPNRQLRAQMESLLSQRRQRSQALQQWLFHQMTFLNAEGQCRSLLDLFHPQLPPSGAGDCCAPKLLQYAYRHHLKPICMAEFWMGASPRDEIRVEGQYYPACQSKCKPILTFMLQGLRVEKNPMQHDADLLESRFELRHRASDYVVVSKPSGLLSVPGKENLPSVWSLVKARCPEACGPMMVHRLDMDTSGLMVVALSDEAYHRLQDLFLQRKVEKTYVALLVRPMPVGEEGDIRLPLMPDYMDRPRQKVDVEKGKEAVTHYRVLDTVDGHALVALYPKTGRTHQLRVHCAHRLGLGNPIVGDVLYGTPDSRLMLHAARLAFEGVDYRDSFVFDCIDLTRYEL